MERGDSRTAQLLCGDGVRGYRVAKGIDEGEIPSEWAVLRGKSDSNAALDQVGVQFISIVASKPDRDANPQSGRIIEDLDWRADGEWDGLRFENNSARGAFC
ncbi:hypothetical protein CHELA20_50985 [Hyphomicrobiales bacterium]|nr:hypothetical protein CHELA20_50985 [Hyphomicrobiales bacterium]